MRRYSMFALGIILVALFAVSCKSAPPAEEPAPVPDRTAAPAVPAVPAPDAELKQAESLKETIEKYGLSFAKPEEFQKANEELAAGRDLMGKDKARAKTTLDSSIVRYNDVMNAGISQGAQARMTEMSTARRQAADLRADINATSGFRYAEQKLAETNKLYGEKKYLEAWDASGEAITAFNESYEISRGKRSDAQRAMDTSGVDQAATSDKLEEVTKEIGGAQ